MYRKLKPPILTTEGIIGIVVSVLFIVLLILSFRIAMAFDHNGNITVNISQTDYFMYKDLLSFDKLCQSLGELFIKFMEQYRNGEGNRVIEHLDSLQLNIITEG